MYRTTISVEVTEFLRIKKLNQSREANGGSQKAKEWAAIETKLFAGPGRSLTRSAGKKRSEREREVKRGHCAKAFPPAFGRRPLMIPCASTIRDRARAHCD